MYKICWNRSFNTYEGEYGLNIELKHIYFKYDSLSRQDYVLKDINLALHKGEFVALVGPSGSGKTTLMQLFTGLLKPEKGEILINGMNLWGQKTDLNKIRREIGLVFQFPESQLFEETIFQDIAFGPKQLGLAPEDIEKRIRRAMQAVQLDFDEFKNRNPLNLSSGEKRRVALAGVLAMQPRMLILDEPTAGLDYAGTQAIVKILKSLNQQGITILLISHNMDLVWNLAGRIVILHQGSIYFDDAKIKLQKSPQILLNAGLDIPRILKVIQLLKSKKLIQKEKISDLTE
ncbi:MAG: ATP-binding cassette domain-containing protein [Calditrichaeota bacterium]|nr:MAG: ATP-binding cassette domain-containing protein [Calditrichota bacterium]